MKYIGPHMSAQYRTQALILIHAHPVLAENTSTGLHFCDSSVSVHTRKEVAVVAVADDDTVKGALSLIRTCGVSRVVIARINKFVLTRDASLDQLAMAWTMLHRAMESLPPNWLLIVHCSRGKRCLYDEAGFKETHRVHESNGFVKYYSMVYGRLNLSSVNMRRLTTLDHRNTGHHKEIWRCSTEACNSYGAYTCPQVG